jgi:predicted Na+-dependent transporter
LFASAGTSITRPFKVRGCNMEEIMDWILQSLLGIALIIFMVGSLLEVGLKLKLKEAIGATRNLKFLSLSVLWAFVLCPSLAVLLGRVRFLSI